MKSRIIAAFLFLTTFSQAEAQTQAPAFPGAEGFARYSTTGGRGKKVYHVTNLNDSGVGSLRDAVSQGDRIIVFDVSGYIDLKSDLKISKSNITIAGQTAPGDGITIRYYTLNFADAKADNIIVRFLRFRRSQVKDVNDGADAAWGRKNKNIILDHCSFSWSIDEVASFYDNRDFTMQWCTLGEGLNEPGHSKGAHSYGGIWGGKNASFHHNMICHVQNRAPRFNGARYNWDGFDKDVYENTIQAERIDFRNCVMYNWGTGNGCYGGPGGGYVNMVNNYYKAGPATKNKTRVTQVSVGGSSDTYVGYTSLYYIKGNYVTEAKSPADYDWSGVIFDKGVVEKDGEKYCKDEKHLYGSSQKYASIDGADCVSIKQDNPFDAGEVTTHSAESAFDKVLAYSGASLVRDAVDARYVEEARTGSATYTGEVSALKGIVDLVNAPSATANSNRPSFPELKQESRPAGFDTDQDGMPDEWETANGLNPDDASDANSYTIDDSKGFYTNLEVYLNSLVEDIVRAQNADAVEAVNEYYPSSSKPSALESVSSVPVRFLYFDLNGKPVSKPAGGIFIRKQIFSDGTVITDKVIAQ